MSAAVTTRPPGPARTAPRWRFGDGYAPIAEVVRRGGVVAFPTESSYALGADPRSARGVAAVFEAKGRQRSKPLPVVCADTDQLDGLGIDPNDPGVARARQAWPAALTVVARLRSDLPPDSVPAAGGGPSLAVRIPDHGPLRALLEAVGPLTATSANASGEAPILDPGDLDRLLAGRDAMVVDAGCLAGGAPSTLVAWRHGRFAVLRAGAFDAGAERSAPPRGRS